MRSLNNLSLNYYLAYTVGESRVNNITMTRNEEFFYTFYEYSGKRTDFCWD